jgi:hypothetical protein
VDGAHHIVRCEHRCNQHQREHQTANRFHDLASSND